MANLYKVTRNVVKGNEVECTALVALAHSCGAIAVNVEIDLDSAGFNDGEYDKWYIEATFDNRTQQELFANEGEKLIKKLNN